MDNKAKIIELFNKNKKIKEIMNELDLKYGQVYRIINQYKKTKEEENNESESENKESEEENENKVNNKSES